METIFDFLNSILFSKAKKNLTQENSSVYTPFMINRWCSFYSKELSRFINLSVNRFSNFNKEEHFIFLRNFLPKLPFKKISYVKKIAVENETDNTVCMLAKNLELSRREINHYILCQKYLSTSSVPSQKA